MPRTSTVPNDLSRRGKYGLELAKHKLKIRIQKEEIEKLKRALRSQSVVVANLKKSNDYLLEAAEPVARPNGESEGS
jgi:hypothetical protein